MILGFRVHGKLFEGEAALIRNSRLVSDPIEDLWNKFLRDLLRGDKIDVMLAKTAYHPTSHNPYFLVLVGAKLR